MDYKEFQEKIPYDPGDIFWTHIDILRKNKTVSVNHKNTEVKNVNSQPIPPTASQSNSFGMHDKDKPTPVVKKPTIFMPYPPKSTGKFRCLF